MYHVVHDFVDAELFSPEGNNNERLEKQFSRLRPLIFVPQRAVTLKKVDTVIRALPRVLEECPSAHVIIAGGGSLVSSHKALAKELGVERRCTWLGTVSYKEDMPTLYRIADVVVITSSSEGAQPSPTAAEAMAAGTPVIMTTACDTEGILEWVVSTYSAGDTETLASRILQALKDSEQSTKRAEEARTIILKRFSQESFLQKFRNVYQQVLLDNPIER